MVKTLICSILLLSFLGSALAAEDHCYALALEGGGDKGAYQAGALSEILKHHNDETVAYDIVTGISVGAINGAALANFAQGDEAEAADFITDMWMMLTKEQVFKDWNWGGAVRGLLFKTGIYDDGPLKRFLASHITEPKREFVYGMVDAASGEYCKKDNHEDFDRYIKGIVGSASFPGMFPVVDDLDEGHMYYDGGVAWVVDIATAVNFCKDKMDGDESKVTIDILLNSGGTFKDKDASNYHAIRMGLRYLEIRNFYRTMDLILRAQAAYRDVNFRYVIAPTYKLETGILPFHFDHKEIEHNIQHGIEDAKEAIAIGEGETVSYLVEYAKMKMEGRMSQDYGDYLTMKKAAKEVTQ